ncbi:MAG: hypothetical protein M2R45_04305 [Verrucomicrobia subdivision 3 bacterium]|nr:hypothetical protein [Limisphaerales bacterium]MCS1417220.1 hypothetical protein [Limisphaerales bacterium]
MQVGVNAFGVQTALKKHADEIAVGKIFKNWANVELWVCNGSTLRQQRSIRCVSEINVMAGKAIIITQVLLGLKTDGGDKQERGYQSLIY